MYLKLARMVIMPDFAVRAGKLPQDVYAVICHDQASMGDSREGQRCKGCERGGRGACAGHPQHVARGWHARIPASMRGLHDCSAAASPGLLDHHPHHCHR